MEASAAVAVSKRKGAESDCCPVSERIGREIKAALVRQRMDAKDLAAKIGEGPDFVNRRLNGNIEMKVSDLIRLAEAMGFDPAALLALAIKLVAEEEDGLSGSIPPLPRNGNLRGRPEQTPTGDTELF